jgi:hypothetical protein
LVGSFPSSKFFPTPGFDKQLRLYILLSPRENPSIWRYNQRFFGSRRAFELSTPCSETDGWLRLGQVHFLLLRLFLWVFWYLFLLLNQVLVLIVVLSNVALLSCVPLPLVWQLRPGQTPGAPTRLERWMWQLRRGQTLRSLLMTPGIPQATLVTHCGPAYNAPQYTLPELDPYRR